MPEEAPDAESLRFRAGIERMRRRWPAIAKAADHPLTEVCVALRRSWRWGEFLFFAVAFGGSAFAFVGGLFAIPLLTGHPLKEYELLFIALIAISVMFALTRRGRGAKERIPTHLSLSERIAKYNPEELWLTPLSYRDLVGAECGAVYLRHGRAVESGVGGAVWLLFGVLGCLGVQRLFQGSTLGGDIWLLLSGLFAFWLSILPIAPHLEVYGAHRRMSSEVRRQLDRALGMRTDKLIRIAGAATALLFAAVMTGLPLLLAFAAFMETVEQEKNSFPIWGWGTLFWLAAGCMTLLMSRLLPGLVEFTFQRAATAGQRTWEKAILAASERP